MEVDSHSKEDNIAALSPAPTKTLGKVNGDEELDFTITMNESDDEGSNNATSSELVKASVEPISPAQVNGKLASDDDSQTSAPDSSKVTSDTGKSAKTGSEESGGVDRKETAMQQNGEKEDGADTEEKVTVEKKEEEERDCGNQSKEQGEGEGSDAETAMDKESAGEKDTLTQTTGDKSDPDDQEIKADSNEREIEGDKGEADSSEQNSKEKKVKSERETTPVKKTDTGKKVEDEDDDDVVEIEDSPLKVDSGGGQTSSFKFPTTAGGSASNLVLDARTGASLPYMATAQGASLLPTTSGVQLLLPQGTSGVQGSTLMYVPNSGTILTTSAASYLSAMNTTLQSQARGHANVLFSQYANMMTTQANRFVMSTQQNQASRVGQPVLSPAMANIPEKPTSSKGMIDMIRWEVENHINIKPKYVRPNPKADLGNLAKWCFDLGSDLVKEYVYHDLVRIQHRRKDEGSLSEKEKDDFSKLQQIDKELNEKIGHLKYKMPKSCKCGFKTELDSVLYNHQQYAHTDRGGFMSCALCKYTSRQPNVFRVHMEGEHGRVGKMENRPSFYECPLCPYETNYTNRLDQHKVRCLRQFREAFNLHPSCMTGPEVNLCLENVFYFVFTRQFMNSIIPKVTTAPVTTATKIRDMAAKTATANPMLTSRPGGTTATHLATSARQIAPQQHTKPAILSRQQQQPNTLSRNFPVISSKISTITSQGVPTYVANQAAAIAKQAMQMTRTQTPSQPSAPNQPNSTFEVCEICGGYVKDRKALRIHFFYAHRIDMPFGVFERPQPPLYCATCFARFWTAQGLQKHIEIHKNDMVNTTQTNNGVAGKCISCGHRVPNILMHMRMVHNRELRHYLAALMCIFCGNRFLTKKETENHMSKMHGVIVKNSSVQSSVPPSTPASQTNTHPVQPPKTPVNKPSPGPAANTKPGSSGRMNRSSQCVLCNLSFSRNVDLTRHCMRVHHTCMKCGLVVVDKESLSRHTCLHSASGMRTCEVCRDSGFHPAYYIKHMRDKHLRKCSVVLRRIDRAVVETMKRPITISDSEDDEPLSASLQPKKQKMEDADAKQADPGDADSQKDRQDSTNAGEAKSESSSTSRGELATVNKEEKNEDRENGDNDEEDPKEEEKDGRKDETDSEVSEKKERQPVEQAQDTHSDAEPKSNSVVTEKAGPVGDEKDNVPERGEKDGSRDTAQDAGSGAEDGHSHGDSDTKSSDQAEDSPGRRCTRSRKSDAEIDDEKQNSVDEKTVSDNENPDQDRSPEPASPKKRKADKSDSEDGSVRKSLRRNGSKGGDSMDLD